MKLQNLAHEAFLALISPASIRIMFIESIANTSACGGGLASGWRRACSIVLSWWQTVGRALSDLHRLCYLVNKHLLNIFVGETRWSRLLLHYEWSGWPLSLLSNNLTCIGHRYLGLALTSPPHHISPLSMHSSLGPSSYARTSECTTH